MFSFYNDLSHMAHVKDAGIVADCQVFFIYAGIAYGHAVAREIDHLCSEFLMN